MRTAMRALVVSSRSIDAIRRANREAEGASEIAVVLDIWSPLFWKAAVPLRCLQLIYVYQMPVTTDLFA